MNIKNNEGCKISKKTSILQTGVLVTEGDFTQGSTVL
jgi:hypothetical protein